MQVANSAYMSAISPILLLLNSSHLHADVPLAHVVHEQVNEGLAHGGGVDLNERLLAHHEAVAYEGRVLMRDDALTHAEGGKLAHAATSNASMVLPDSVGSQMATMMRSRVALYTVMGSSSTMWCLY